MGRIVKSGTGYVILPVSGEEAIRGFDTIGMRLPAAWARRRLGALRAGSEGSALIAEADRFMHEQTIASPACFAAMYAPGFPD